VGKIVVVVSLPSRLRTLVASYPELTAVLAAAVLGLSARRPLAWLAGREGINVLLAVLVFATAVTIEPAALRRAAAAWRPLLAALGAGIAVLPPLSWAVSLLVAAGPLRDGVMAVGLAPCEIASIATTAMAGGEAALSAGVLIGSTVITVAFAGSVLSLEAGHASVSPGGIAANLALVVALPLAVGIALRAGQLDTASRAVGLTPRADGRSVSSALATARAQRAASATAVFAVAALVALIAAEVRLSARYAAVGAALVLFLAGSALAGRLLGARSDRPVAAALLLTTSMRDFAIAAGLAAAAFGPAAAAPLGLYGILVLVWGTAVAGFLRQRTASTRLLRRRRKLGHRVGDRVGYPDAAIFHCHSAWTVEPVLVAGQDVGQGAVGVQFGYRVAVKICYPDVAAVGAESDRIVELVAGRGQYLGQRAVGVQFGHRAAAKICYPDVVAVGGDSAGTVEPVLVAGQHVGQGAVGVQFGH
jgi:predicted Na+-dependent transporter